MDDAARSRLQVFGRLCVTAGLALQQFGEAMQGSSPVQIEPQLDLVANLLLDASNIAHELSALMLTDHANGKDHGYEALDSPAMAGLWAILGGFGAIVAAVNKLSFTLPADQKAAIWAELAATLRASTEAAWRQATHLAACLPPPPDQEEELVPEPPPPRRRSLPRRRRWT